MQSKGQTSMHTPQPLQLSGWTTAIGRSWRLSTLVTLPQVSRMASSGQMTPHAPQSMQSPGSIRKAFLSSPEMARVGQRFSHAVQPVPPPSRRQAAMLRWLPENVSTYGPDIDRLFYVIYSVPGATFFVVQIALRVFIVLYRHRDGRRATYTHGNSSLGIAWTIALA